jgi:hypothetical protein
MTFNFGKHWMVANPFERQKNAQIAYGYSVSIFKRERNAKNVHYKACLSNLGNICYETN